MSVSAHEIVKIVEQCRFHNWDEIPMSCVPFKEMWPAILLVATQETHNKANSYALKCFDNRLMGDSPAASVFSLVGLYDFNIAYMHAKESVGDETTAQKISDYVKTHASKLGAIFADKAIPQQLVDDYLDHFPFLKKEAEIRRGQKAVESQAIVAAPHVTSLSTAERLANGLRLPLTRIIGPSSVSKSMRELYDAIDKGDRGRVQNLLKCLTKEEINSDCYRGVVPVAYAAGKGQIDILLDLVEAGAADYNLTEGMEPKPPTALYRAAFFGQAESIRVLLDLGAKTSDKGRNSAGLLSNLLPAVKEGHLECVKLLVEASSDVNDSDLNVLSKDEYTALYYARVDKFSGVNVSRMDEYTALYYACVNGHADIMEVLFSKGARFELAFPGETQEEVIKKAARAGHLEVVQLFVSRGAKLEVERGEEYSALDYAIINGHHSVVKYLESLNAPYSKENVREERSINAWEVLGSVCRTTEESALKYGFSSVDECIAALLPEHVNEAIEISTNRTLLHLVTLALGVSLSLEGRIAQRELIEKLLAVGADRSLKDSCGQTPFDIAQACMKKCEKNTPETLELSRICKLLQPISNRTNVSERIRRKRLIKV